MTRQRRRGFTLIELLVAIPGGATRGVFYTLLASLFTIVGLARADGVDDLVRAEMKRQNIPGLSIAVVREGKVIKEAGYGVANIELDSPATAETVYECGSVSKPMVAALVM